MKRKYIKPELLYEQYMLNQHMATECAWENDKENPNVFVGNKAYGLEGLSIFQLTGVCVITEENAQEFCYHNAAVTYTTFGSGV